MGRIFNTEVVFRSSAVATASSSTHGTVIDMSDAHGLVARLRATAESGAPTLKVWFQARYGNVWYDMPTAGTQPNKWTYGTLTNQTGARILRMQYPIPGALRLRSVVAGGTITWQCEGHKVILV